MTLCESNDYLSQSNNALIISFIYILLSKLNIRLCNQTNIIYGMVMVSDSCRSEKIQTRV